MIPKLEDVDRPGLLDLVRLEEDLVLELRDPSDTSSIGL